MPPTPEFYELLEPLRMEIETWNLAARRRDNAARVDAGYKPYQWEPANYRILKSDDRYLNAGTDSPSWFTLEQARALVDYSQGQRIMEICKVTRSPLWETF